MKNKELQIGDMVIVNNLSMYCKGIIGIVENIFEEVPGDLSKTASIKPLSGNKSLRLKIYKFDIITREEAALKILES